MTPVIVVGLPRFPEDALAGVASDLAFLSARGDRVLLVHGAPGSAGPDALPETWAANKRIAAAIQSREGVRAAGISGADGRLLEPASAGDEVPKVSPDLARILLQNRIVPVVASLALRDGGIVPVPAAAAAAVIAGAFSAEALLLLDLLPGLLDVPGDMGSLRKTLTRAEAECAAADAEGPLREDLLAALLALRSGVSRVVIGEACIPSPVLRALEGRGTVLR